MWPRCRSKILGNVFIHGGIVLSAFNNVWVVSCRQQQNLCDQTNFGKVLHMRDQIQAGLGVADSFMERRLLMLCSDKNLSQSFGGLIRRSLADAGQRFDATDVNKTHYLGFTDLTKYGRLSAIAVNEVANWCHQLLNQNPNYSFMAQLITTFGQIHTPAYSLCSSLACTLFHTFARHGLHMCSCSGWWWCDRWHPRGDEALFTLSKTCWVLKCSHLHVL